MTCRWPIPEEDEGVCLRCFTAEVKEVAWTCFLSASVVFVVASAATWVMAEFL